MSRTEIHWVGSPATMGQKFLLFLTVVLFTRYFVSRSVWWVRITWTYRMQTSVLACWAFCKYAHPLCFDALVALLWCKCNNKNGGVPNDVHCCRIVLYTCWWQCKFCWNICCSPFCMDCLLINFLYERIYHMNMSTLDGKLRPDSYSERLRAFWGEGGLTDCRGRATFTLHNV